MEKVNETAKRWRLIAGLDEIPGIAPWIRENGCDRSLLSNKPFLISMPVMRGPDGGRCRNVRVL
jgi:hypothetical protein